MEKDDRQLLLTTAWLFARHGQGARARILCEALVEDDPQDGIAAAALADFLLDEGDAARALAVLAAAKFPLVLRRAEALLETRALQLLGRKEDASLRWRRYVASSKGAGRTWVAAAAEEGR